MIWLLILDSLTLSLIGRNLCTLETWSLVSLSIATSMYDNTLYLYYEGDFLLTLRFIAILRCVRRPKTSLP